MNKRQFGNEGEADARDYLVRKGIRVLEMNYRRPTGEIDIIARLGKTLLLCSLRLISAAHTSVP